MSGLLPSGVVWASPFVLVAGVLLPLYWLARRRQQRRDRVPFAPLELAAGPRRRGGALLVTLETVVLALVIVALAGPARTTTTELVIDEGIDVALVLDVSLSMLAEDFEPTRLDALRRIAGEFLTRRAHDRTALVIFAKDVYVQSPLTTDDVVLERLLAGVTVDAVDQARSGGTAIGDALLVAADQLHDARIEGRDQSIVLITDGESNEGIAPETAVRHLGELGIELRAVGIGGTERIEVLRYGERLGEDGLWTLLDEEFLRSLTESVGGRYYRAADEGVLEEVFAELSRLDSAPLETRVLEHRRTLVPALAAVLLAFYVAYVALGAGYLRRPLR